jgi:hypothetical protein
MTLRQSLTSLSRKLFPSALTAQVFPEEGHRVAAQGQSNMAIVLDHFATGGHGPERYRGFAEFRDGFCLAG